MHEFPGFIYLDPPKTGTTFISDVLARNADEVAFLKHKPARRAALRKRPFVFTSIRHPFEWYRSTYSYGVRKDGGGRKALYAHYGQDRIEGLFDHTPEHFNEWLRLYLDLQDAEHPLFVPTPGWGNVGHMTYRFMKLALKHHSFTPSHAAILARYRKALPRAYVRVERLRSDLAAILRGPLRARMRDPEGALRTCSKLVEKNVSPRANELPIRSSLRDRIRDRERSMFALWDSLHENPKTGIVTSTLQE